MHITSDGRISPGAGFGGMSGRPLLPLNLYLVWSSTKVTKKPIIGCGGIWTGEDVLRYIWAGAQAVQFYTVAHIEGPKAISRILNELKETMEKEGIKSLSKIRGKARVMG